MITNTNPLGSVPAAVPHQVRLRGASPAPVPIQGDTLSTVSANNLEAALADQPAIRPEVVERARTIATDPYYPPLQIIAQLATMISAANDLSKED
jgi:hypothetical protein